MGTAGMWRAIKLIFWLVVLGAIGLLAYAYVGPVFFPGDFEPPVREMRQDVTLGEGD